MKRLLTLLALSVVMASAHVVRVIPLSSADSEMLAILDQNYRRLADQADKALLLLMAAESQVKDKYEPEETGTCTWTTLQIQNSFITYPEWVNTCPYYHLTDDKKYLVKEQ